MNGFLVGDTSDVQEQELFVERPSNFVVAKHLPLKHRRPDAAADSDGNGTGEQAEGHSDARGQGASLRKAAWWVMRSRIPFAGPQR